MYFNEHQFSQREKEVTGLLLQGKSNKQIALSLGISTSTVEYHLKNIYKKLQVNSRTEAVLRLGKSTGAKPSGQLGKSTVEIDDDLADNRGKSISTRRLPMKNWFYLLAGSLLVVAVMLMIGFANQPAQNGRDLPTLEPSLRPSATTPSLILPSTPSPTEPFPSHWQEPTYTNPLGSANVTLTLKWFYIDATRVSLEFLVSGFPIPEGYTPVQIVKSFSLQTQNGDLLTPEVENIQFNRNEKQVKDSFDELVFFPIGHRELFNSQEEAYIFDITLGGVPVYDNQGNYAEELLPSTTFHFEAKPAFLGSLTFLTDKAANIGDKVVTFKGAEINSTFSIITLCVFSPDQQQWIPNAALLYKGNAYNFTGFALTQPKPEQGEELCYRLQYPFQYDFADNPKQALALWVTKLTKGQPERLPNELISATFQKLSAQGIEFSYVVGAHGTNLEITKKPVEMTEAEASTLIQAALTENALTSGVLIFDLK